MTIMEMLQQGEVFRLIGMGIIFIFWVILLNAVGNKPVPKDTNSSHVQEQKTGTSPAVIAAITAAVKEYRKK
ncbi:MAG: sodium pump decarboxylase subunit gamma [Treponema sp.]|nr:sodium pump decarboxylase subunit gamma [Treponema sp.]MCL2252506.1 sodium pump decarboxylase subunit gamma [Treponema sp.]